MKRLLSLFLSVVLLTTLSVPAAAAGNYPFQDISASHWASDAVGYVYENNLMNGTSPTAFQPEGTLTRAMFVTILGRMDGVETSQYSGSQFSDVAPGQWYSPYVAWSFQNHIVNGTGGGRFSPDLAVTREEIATMIARYVDTQGLTLPEADRPAAPFTDQAAISSWAKEGVELMRQTGLLSGYGDGRFGPHQTATRAEAATIFMRLDKGFSASDPSPDAAALASYREISEEVTSMEADYTNRDGFVTKDQLPALLNEVEAYAKSLYNKGIVSEYDANDTCVYLKIGGWLGFVYDPPMENLLSGGGEVSLVTLEPMASEFYPYYLLAGAKGPDEAAKLIEKTFGSNFSFTGNYDNAEVTLDTVKNLPSNSVVIWFGHGNYLDQLGSILFLGTKKWDPATILLYQKEFSNDALLTNGKGQFYITPVFFEKYMPKDALRDSLVYLATCSSFADSRLPQSILNHGARAVLGNSTIVEATYDFKMLYSFFERMSMTAEDGSYYTISQALAYAKKENGDHDDYFLGAGSKVLAAYRDDFALPDMLQDAERNISGKVIDANANAPLSSVKVTLTCLFGAGGEEIGATATTAKDGSFSLKIPDNATFLTGIRFEKDGYDSDFYPLDTDGSSSFQIGTVALTPANDFWVQYHDVWAQHQAWANWYQTHDISSEAYRQFLEDHPSVRKRPLEENATFYYAFQDIDRNGTKELLIGLKYPRDTAPQIIDVFCYDGNKPVHLFPLSDIFGGPGNTYSLYSDGSLVTDLHATIDDFFFVKGEISADGYSLKTTGNVFALWSPNEDGGFWSFYKNASYSYAIDSDGYATYNITPSQTELTKEAFTHWATGDTGIHGEEMPLEWTPF